MQTFENFNDVKNDALRVFNRTVTMNNIFSDFGEVPFKEYVGQFSDIERKQMFVMNGFIKNKGYKAAKMWATQGVEFEEDQVAVH